MMQRKHGAREMIETSRGRRVSFRLYFAAVRVTIDTDKRVVLLTARPESLRHQRGGAPILAPAETRIGGGRR